jgi:hypothetical protein
MWSGFVRGGTQICKCYLNHRHHLNTKQLNWRDTIYDLCSGGAWLKCRLTEVSVGFLCHQANVRIVQEVRPQSLPSVTLQIHCPLMILSFGALFSELLTLSLNKTRTIKTHPLNSYKKSSTDLCLPVRFGSYIHIPYVFV